MRILSEAIWGFIIAAALAEAVVVILALAMSEWKVALLVAMGMIAVGLAAIPTLGVVIVMDYLTERQGK